MNKRRPRKYKLSINEYKMQNSDRSHLVNMFKHINYLNTSNKNTHIKKLLQDEISGCRSELNNEYAYKFWNVTLFLGPHKYEELFPYYPLHEDIIRVKNSLNDMLAEKRKNKSVMRTESKEFNGMRYELTGSTFSSSGSILKLYDSDEYKNRIRRAKLPYDKSNYVGIELELIARIDRNALNELFIKAKLAGNVYVKGDSSIRVENTGDYSHEVTLIAKESNIENIIERVCEVLNHKDVGGYVNNSCGLHVHLDMRNRNIDKCYKNFYYSLNILSGMVPQLRIKGDEGRRYCAINNTEEWKQSATSRYTAINAAAYLSHKTIEIRLHSGSINAKKINNWVKILVAIVNKKETLNVGIITVDEMQQAFNLNSDLVDYIYKRTDKFSKDSKLDTRKDHFELSA